MERIPDLGKTPFIIGIAAEFFWECGRKRFPGGSKLNPPKENLKGGVEVEERRRMKRHAFSATTEVVDAATGARLSSRAADLSLNGCYLDSLNPFVVGSKIRIRIAWGGADLTCAAVVRDSQPGMGMGVAFTDLDDARRALIQKWIEKLDSSTVVDLSPSNLSDNFKSAPSPDSRDALAVRLIELLQKKGLLTANDVAGLLRDKIV
jgi:hypothetical protein